MRLNEAFERVLTVLPTYMEIRWASILDTISNRLISFYPEHAKPVKLKNITTTENVFEDKYEDLQAAKPYISYEDDAGNIIIYETIDNQHALIVSTSPDIPRGPAEAICEHIILIIKQLLETKNEYEENIQGT